MMVVMGVESERGLSFRIFLVLDSAPLKENIGDGSKVGGTPVKGPTPGLRDEEVAMTSILPTVGGGRVAAVAPGRLHG